MEIYSNAICTKYYAIQLAVSYVIQLPVSSLYDSFVFAFSWVGIGCDRIIELESSLAFSMAFLARCFMIDNFCEFQESELPKGRSKVDSKIVNLTNRIFMANTYYTKFSFQ